MLIQFKEAIRISRQGSSYQVEDTHPDAECRDEGTQPVPDNSCTPDNAPKASLVVLDEGGPGCSDVGGSADEEEDHNDHAVEAEESTLSGDRGTIEEQQLRSDQLIIKLTLNH